MVFYISPGQSYDLESNNGAMASNVVVKTRKNNSPNHNLFDLTVSCNSLKRKKSIFLQEPRQKGDAGIFPK